MKMNNTGWLVFPEASVRLRFQFLFALFACFITTLSGQPPLPSSPFFDEGTITNIDSAAKKLAMLTKEGVKVTVSLYAMPNFTLLNYTGIKIEFSDLRVGLEVIRQNNAGSFVKISRSQTLAV